MNAAAGLQPLTQAAAYDLWQVSGTVARARVVTSAGTVVAVPSGPVGVDASLAPGTSGTLVLAEAAGGWSATLNGKPLAPLAAPVDGWAQGFMLPAGGGRLVITRNETARDLSLGVEAVALFVAFVLALPGTRSSVAVRPRGCRRRPPPRPPGRADRPRPRAAGAGRQPPAPRQRRSARRQAAAAVRALAGADTARPDGARASQDGDDTGGRAAPVGRGGGTTADPGSADLDDDAAA